MRAAAGAARCRVPRALLVEALVLMAVLSCCLALLVQAFAVSAGAAADARDLTRATIAAADAAERFCADPAGVPAASSADGLAVTLERTQERRATGTLWHAVVEVRPEGDPSAEPLCTLETARFEPWGVG